MTLRKQPVLLPFHAQRALIEYLMDLPAVASVDEQESGKKRKYRKALPTGRNIMKSSLSTPQIQKVQTHLVFEMEVHETKEALQREELSAMTSTAGSILKIEN